MVMKKDGPGYLKTMLFFISTDELCTICPAGIPQVDAEAFEGFMVNFFGEPGKECIIRTVIVLKKSLGQFKEAFLETSPGKLIPQISQLPDAPLGILLHFLDTAVNSRFYKRIGYFFCFQ